MNERITADQSPCCEAEMNGGQEVRQFCSTLIALHEKWIEQEQKLLTQIHQNEIKTQRLHSTY